MSNNTTSSNTIINTFSYSSVVRAAKDFTAGTFSGWAVVMVGHPFNTVKARLQLQPTVPAPLYTGMVDCVRKTVLHEGWRGLYKGMASPMAGIGLVNATVFYANEQAKRSLFPTTSTLLSMSICGAVAGAAGSIVCSPVELVMVRLQTQSMKTNRSTNHHIDGPIKVLRTLVKHEGVSALYKGFAATFYREFWSMGAYFGTYGAISSGSDLRSTQFIAGGIAGMAAQAISLPFDAVKIRLQTCTKPTSSSTITSVASVLLKTEGVRGFFKGFGPVALRAFPANGAAFVTFEVAIDLLH